MRPVEDAKEGVEMNEEEDKSCEYENHLQDWLSYKLYDMIENEMKEVIKDENV